jgi:Tfp pilus assembly protein PilN
MNKTGTHAFVNQLLVYTLVTICLSGSVGLASVWMQQQIATASNSIKQLETQAGELERRQREVNSTIAEEQSPMRLEERNRAWRLGLVQPTEQQIERVHESPQRRLERKLNDERFGGQSLSLFPVRYAAGGSR